MELFLLAIGLFACVLRAFEIISCDLFKFLMSPLPDQLDFFQNGQLGIGSSLEFWWGNVSRVASDFHLNCLEFNFGSEFLMFEILEKKKAEMV